MTRILKPKIDVKFVKLYFEFLRANIRSLTVTSSKKIEMQLKFSVPKMKLCKSFQNG